MAEPHEERAWLDREVAAFRRAAARHRRYAALLETVLRTAARDLAPLAIIQARAKEIASFAEKALRKQAKYPEPSRQLTDLTGARVITHNREEVERFSAFIERSFDIDWENSIDATQRLRPSEFGYRSVHYVVSLRPDVDYGVPAPASLSGLKAEIQVRTMVEHAWADFAHDVSYKSAFDLPDVWKREIAVIAAELEDIDRGFSRIESGLATYAASYGAYMTEDEIRAETSRLEAVLAHDPENPGLAHRIGKLAMSVGDWERAIKVMTPFVAGTGPARDRHQLERDLGIALCQRHRAHPEGRAFRRGQRLLARAAAPEFGDADAIAALAGTWRGIDDVTARDLYRRAYETDPTDWYPLGNFIEYEVRRTRDASIVDALRPAMEVAAARCEAQATVGVNLPWAYFGLGRLRLLSGRPYEALDAYARGLAASTAAFAVAGELESLEALGAARGRFPGLEWSRRLLLAGLVAKFPSPGPRRRLRRLATQPFAKLPGPIVIVVGGADPRFQEEMEGYGAIIGAAFAGYEGTVISGGTTQGVPGLIGEVAAAEDGVTAIGYLPATLPEDATVDARYGEIRRTGSDGFSPLEPLQNWIDIIASGLDPAEVKVLGINGGAIAAIEYRIALALGAVVGTVAESGRAAARLAGDERWLGVGRWFVLPNDPQTARAFVRPPVGRDGLGAALGKTIHETYRAERMAERSGADEAMRDWEQLPASLRASNRDQGDHIVEKLRTLGYEIVPASEPPQPSPAFTSAEIETMAEMEHGRWTAERLAAGWSWGPERSVTDKRSPYLVAWARLADEIREYDREAVRKIPELLAAAGLEIRRSA